MGDQMKMSCVQTLKLLVIFLGVIAITVGYWGHYNFNPRQQMCSITFREACKLEEECSVGGAMTMEKTFLTLVAIFLLLSAISFLVGAAFDCSKGIGKFVDAIFHFLGGLIVIIGGILMIASAVLIDIYIGDTSITEEGNTHLGCTVAIISPEVWVANCPYGCYWGGTGMATHLARFIGCAPFEFASSDGDVQPSSYVSARMAAFREAAFFHYKTSAGIIAFLNGIVYIVVGVLLLVSKGQSVGDGGGGYPVGATPSVGTPPQADPSQTQPSGTPSQMAPPPQEA